MIIDKVKVKWKFKGEKAKVFLEQGCNSSQVQR